MSQKKTKQIKKAVKKLFESGEKPKTNTEDKVLVAAVNAPPMVQFKKAEDQKGVPSGQVRMERVVVKPPNPLRVAQRTALKKLSSKEKNSLIS